MRKLSYLVMPAILSALSSINLAASSPAHAMTGQGERLPEKEWTFLVYLNGHNNLDSFGFKDINEMEQVGSSDQVNIVVQWASLANKKTKRLYVTKDTDTLKVSSTVLEQSAPVDMGDYRNLIEFIRWGAEKFPAKRYFVDVWNHGSGWHRLSATVNRGGIGVLDISNDDLSGHRITTLELGQAMNEASRLIGKPIEVYGSDACLMQMVEVAAEMSDSVKYFVGSQELEPGDGWPYQYFLKDLVARPTMSTPELGKSMVLGYVDSYNDSGDLTLAMLDLSQLPAVEAAASSLGKAIGALPKSEIEAIQSVVQETQGFYYSDYKDARDFTSKLTAAGIKQFDTRTADDLNRALARMIVANATSSSYAQATGASIWIPAEGYQYSAHAQAYSQLKFHKRTGWGDAAKALSN